MTDSHVNFQFFHALDGKVREGQIMRALADPSNPGVVNRMGLVLGGFIDEKAVPTRGSAVIPADLTDMPVVRGDKVVLGSVVEQVLTDGRKTKIITSLKDESRRCYYVTVRTGLVRKDGGVMQHRAELMNAGGVHPHGSFSLDGGAIDLAAAGLDLELGSIPANQLRWSVKHGNLSGLNMPERIFRLWEVPVGAVVLVGEVDGELTRLIGEEGGLRVADADGKDYRTAFNELESKRQQEAAANRKRYRERTAAQSGDASAAPSTAAAAKPAESSVEPVAPETEKPAKKGWLG